MTADDMRCWRAELGFTQATAASALGLSKSTVAQYEMGESRGKNYPIPNTVALACSAIKEGLAGYSAGKSQDEPYLFDASPMMYGYKVDPELIEWYKEKIPSPLLIIDCKIVIFCERELIRVKLRWSGEGQKPNNFKKRKGVGGIFPNLLE